MSAQEVVAGVIVAAGAGVRLGGDQAKALVRLAGRPLVSWSAAAVAETPGVEFIVVVTPPGPAGAAVARAVADVHADVRTVSGGPRRRDSVLAGVQAARGAEFVLVHDAARPLATAELAARTLAAARGVGAAVPAVPVTEALVRERGGLVGEDLPRTGVHTVQTPQAFRRALLLEAHAAADSEWDAPDDSAMVQRLGRPVALTPGAPDNAKITWPGDLDRAEAWLAARRGGDATVDPPRIGFGWDVHPLVSGRRLALAGVVLSETVGPAGHSDGDPLAHAVADALLGAAALDDLGGLFPDTDPRWAGAPGIEILRRTAAVLAHAGWRARQIDAVVIADAPTIAPHRDRIRAELAAALGLAVHAVWVKGKRTEGLGALAGGAGIACQAVVVIERTS